MYLSFDDSAGLGDWYVDETILPDGLGPVTELVADKGMSFGLWIEPEMVNPDSDLYRNHPDWVLDATPPTLKIACRSAAAATHVRFLAPELLEQLSQLPQYARIENVSVRVIDN